MLSAILNLKSSNEIDAHLKNDFPDPAAPYINIVSLLEELPGHTFPVKPKERTWALLPIIVTAILN